MNNHNRTNVPYYCSPLRITKYIRMSAIKCQLLDEIKNSGNAYYMVPDYYGYPLTNFFIFNERSKCCFHDRSDRPEQLLNVSKRFL